MPRPALPSRSFLDRLRNKADESDRRGPIIRPSLRPPRDSNSGGLGDVITARITAVGGTAQVPLYSATGEFATSISVTLKPVDNRKFDISAVLLQAAQVGNRCWLYRRKNAQNVTVWRILDAEGELWQTQGCDSGGQAGSGITDITTASEHARDERQLTYLALEDQALSITSGATGKHSIQVYTFPTGYIALHDLIVSLRASAPTLTNTLRIAIGTAAATGSGTTLTGTQANIMAQTDFGTLGVSALDFKAVAGLLPLGFDGTSTAVEVHVNFCPSANWTASETLTISQPPAAVRALSMAWRNGGLI